MKHSSKLKTMSKRKRNIWEDSDSNLSSDFDTNFQRTAIVSLSSSSSDVSINENSQSSMDECCLICSILPNLSSINTCHKHLQLITKSVRSRKRISKKQTAVNSHRSNCSSSAKQANSKRSITLTSSGSSSQHDVFCSSNVQSKSPNRDESNNVQNQGSPSRPLASSITITMNEREEKPSESSHSPQPRRSNRQKKQSVLKNIQNESRRRQSIDVDTRSQSSDAIEVDSSTAAQTRDESSTQKNRTEDYPKPVILLTRVRFEEFK